MKVKNKVTGTGGALTQVDGRLLSWECLERAVRDLAGAAVADALGQGRVEQEQEQLASAIAAAVTSSCRAVIAEGRDEPTAIDFTKLPGLPDTIEDCISDFFAQAPVVAALELDAVAAAAVQELTAPLPRPAPTYGKLKTRIRALLQDPFWERARGALQRVSDRLDVADLRVHLVELHPRFAVPLEADEVPVLHDVLDDDVLAVVTVPGGHVPPPRLDAAAKDRIASALADAILAQVT